MKKLIAFIAILVVGFSLATTVKSNSAIDQMEISIAGPLCGYGSTYLGWMYHPAGYVPCYDQFDNFFRDVGICTTITAGGCVEDECKAPCYTIMP